MTFDDTPDPIDVASHSLSSERDYWQRLADRYGAVLMLLGFHSIGTHQHHDAYDAESHYPCDRKECVDALSDRVSTFVGTVLEAGDKYRQGRDEFRHPADRYPTAWAYERACEALEQSKKDRARLHGVLLAHYSSHRGMGVVLTRHEVCATCAEAMRIASE